MFSIGAVTHITGIQEATLRVWERRYHFPQTTRTRGGHRVYSQEEVLQLLWVKMQLDAGMRASEAIRARDRVDRTAAVVAALHEPLQPRPGPKPELVAIRTTLLDTLLVYDGAHANAILSDAVARFAIEDVVLDLVGPTMAAIGDLWCRGRAEVVTEHFATNFLRQHLLDWMRSSPEPYTVSPIVLACAPEELHEGSLLMLGVLLRQARWPVVYLGQSQPLADLGVLVGQVNPSVIAFVAMTEATALVLADWPRWLAPPPDGRPPIIGFGGRAFTNNPELDKQVRGVLLGTTLAEGYQRIHRVMLNLTALHTLEGTIKG